MSFQMVGFGRAHPSFCLSNEALSAFVDTSDEWITTRTGIQSRYICTEETLLDLSCSAAKQALESAGCAPLDLDYIICTTIQADTLTPSLACMVQRAIGAECPAFDLNAACTGFIYALDVARAFFDSGSARKILIVSAEQMSKHVDWTDRETCVLFGDGAGAVVLAKGEGLIGLKLTARGDDSVLKIKAGTGNNPFSKKIPEKHYLKMAGKEVFKFAVTSMVTDLRQLLEKNGMDISGIHKIVAHQANLRILKAAADKLNAAESQIAVNIQRYGNTSSASIPICLSELVERGDVQKGDLIAFAAFGGGLTSAACIIQL